MPKPLPDAAAAGRTRDMKVALGDLSKGIAERMEALSGMEIQDALLCPSTNWILFGFAHRRSHRFVGALQELMGRMGF